jgi:GNAT superfamily N-acetyltransferase
MGRLVSKTISVRDAVKGDAGTIVAGNAAMAMETEGKTLDPGIVAHGVQAALDDAGKGRYWIAEHNGEPVGQIMTSHEWSDWRNGNMWWIQSVYVIESMRRNGVFSALYRHVEELARQDPACCGLRLYVERDNERAQATYIALGMTKPGYDVMEVDFRNDNDQ